MSPSPIIASLASARRRGAIVAPKLLAISNLSASNYYVTPANGGEAGINTGFGNVVMYRLRALSTATQVLRRKIYGANGWQQVLSGLNGLNANYFTGSGNVQTPFIPLNAADVGRVGIFLSRITAVPGTAEAYVSAGLTTSAALPAYSPYAAQPEHLGVDESLGYPAPWVDIIAELDFRGVPTAAQIQAFLLAARSLGNMPTTFTGATITHRRSLIDALAGQAVVDGQLAPATLADTVTGAAADAKTRTGSPTVRVIDTSIDGRKSYGVLGFDGASYLQASGLALAGSASGLGLFGRVLVGGYASAEEFVIGSYGSSGTGWTLYTTPAGGGTLRIYVVGLGDITLGVIPPQSDVTWGFSWDGTQYAGYLNGLVSVGPTAGTGFIRNTDRAFRVGQNSIGGNPATLIAPYLLAGCDANLTAAEQLALHNSLRNTGAVSIPAGKTNPHVFDLTQDVVANGGPDAGVPATIANRAGGSVTLARVGTGLRVSRRTERVWSYETTPVISGFTPVSGSTYYDSSAVGHSGGSATGKSVALLMRIDAQLTNKSREILSLGADTQQRMSIRAIGLNNALNFPFWTGSGYVTSPALAFTTADVGRLMLVAIQWDPTALKARTFARRMQIGTGTDISTWPTAAGMNLRLGMIHLAGTYPTYFSDDLTIFGAQTYDGVWSLAEFQALHDACMAEEDMIAVPGKSGHLWSLKRAIGTSGALPASVADLGTDTASALTRVGTPTLKPHYTHAFAA